MNLKTFVKVGNISNLSDARFCAGFGVDMLGFNIDPTSENYISTESVLEIIGWIAGTDIVVECGALTLTQIKDIQTEYKFPFLQVDTIKLVNDLNAGSTPLLLRQTINSTAQLENLLTQSNEFASKIKFLVISCSNESLYAELDNIIAQNTSSLSIIKGYGVDKDKIVNQLSNMKGLSGLELKGSHEEQAGFKEYDELADVLEALEIE